MLSARSAAPRPHVRAAALLATLALAAAAPAQSVWTNGGGDNQWGTAGNWNPSGVPNSAGATAAFAGGGQVSGVGAVTVGGNFTVGTLQFSAPTGNYNLSGTGTLTLTNLSQTSGA